MERYIQYIFYNTPYCYANRKMKKQSILINASEAIALMRDSCSHIGPDWEEHLEFWDDDDPGYYNEAIVIANYVVNRIEFNSLKDMPSIFQAIENIIENGTDEAKTIAIYGFLESARNIASHQAFTDKALIPFLGPLAQEAWKHLAALWSENNSLADIIRAERRQTQ